MISAVRVLYYTLFSMIGILCIMNLPGSMIPLWAIPIGTILRTILVMCLIFVPCGANLFLAYTAYYREDYIDARNILTLLLLVTMGYTYTALPLGVVFSICIAVSFVFFYGMWWYRDHYFEQHVTSFERYKNKKRE